MTIARVLPRTTAALDPGAIVASTAEATLRSLWAAPETKTARAAGRRVRRRPGVP